MAHLRRNIFVQKKGLILVAVHNDFEPKEDRAPGQTFNRDVSLSLSECVSMLPVRITRCYRCSRTNEAHDLDAFTEMVSQIQGIAIERHVGKYNTCRNLPDNREEKFTIECLSLFPYCLY